MDTLVKSDKSYAAVYKKNFSATYGFGRICSKPTNGKVQAHLGLENCTPACVSGSLVNYQWIKDTRNEQLDLESMDRK